MKKHFILELYLKAASLPLAVHAVMAHIADGVSVEWAFMEEQRHMCKIRVTRAAWKMHVN